MTRRLAAIMYTDLTGYTALTQADETGALRLLQEQEKLVRPLLELYHGRKVKSMGDGLLIEFPDALDAVECAVELQRRVHEHDAQEGAQPLGMRVGIHLGDVQRRGTDILGDAVNIASRVEPLADPGGVCLSEPVFVQVRNKVPYPFENIGAKNLKGVREPIDVYRVVLPWTAGEPPPGRPTLPRLAVLPLTNMSPDPTDEYFADGLTEELISTISKVRDLNVISRTSVMQYKTHPKRMAEIGRELDVGTILEGSVRKAGNKVRITVQLIDPVTDKHLWAENYDRNLEDIFSIQSEIARKVAGELEIQLRKEEKERIGVVPTQVTEAHLLYLKGLAYRQSFGKEELLKAVECFEQAIRKDPRYAPAYAGLGWAAGQIAFNEMLPSEEILPKAREAAEKALELDDSLAEAHVALSWVHLDSWDSAAALNEARRALDLGPNLAMVHAVAAWIYFCRGQFREARAEADRSVDLDPLSTHSLEAAGAIYLYSGAPERALELFGKLTTMDPANSFAVGNVGLCHVYLGKYEEGLREINKGIGMGGEASPGKLADLAYALVRAGRIDEARRVLAELVQYHEEYGRAALCVASACASLGDREQAIDWLETAYHEHAGHLLSMAGGSMDRSFEALASDPRYQSLLRRVKPA